MSDSSFPKNYYGQVRRDIFELVPRCQRLIDVGGGLGQTAIALKKSKVCDIAGVVDLVAPLDDSELDFAFEGDLADPALLERITREQGPFDVALLLDVVEHFACPEALVKGIYTSIKPGGCLIASIPNVRHCSVLLPLLFGGRWDYEDEGVLDRTHLRFFTRNTARALIENAGFQIERILPSATASRWQRLGNALTLGLMRDFFTIQYYFVATLSRAP